MGEAAGGMQGRRRGGTRVRPAGGMQGRQRGAAWVRPAGGMQGRRRGGAWVRPLEACKAAVHCAKGLPHAAVLDGPTCWVHEATRRKLGWDWVPRSPYTCRHGCESVGRCP
eukprot:355337-Chlamydomonas_euryale.AAC.3